MTQPSLLPYDIAATAGAGTSTFPLAVLVTEFHFVLLFAERIVGISRLTERIVWEEGLNLVSSSQYRLHLCSSELIREAVSRRTAKSLKDSFRTT